LTKYHVALSFAGEDREYVKRVAQHLKDNGVNVFYDEFEDTNLWGKNLYDYLADVYENRATYIVMFVSKSYNKKLWTNHERKAAQARAFKEHREYILPAKFDEEVEIPGLLSTTAYIPLNNLEPEEFGKKIIQKLQEVGILYPEEIGEWIIESAEPERTASNGLRYLICRLRHSQINGRLARGKRYDTRSLKKGDREELSNQYFTRHAEIYNIVKNHPNIPIHHSLFPYGYGHNFWWVIDEWIEGDKLDTIISYGALPEQKLLKVMKGIANGLKALHKAQIIRRELSPNSIIIRKDNNNPVLTDFELAKLLNGSQTVSNSNWQEDIYRAPEVESRQELTVRADLFSWSAILAHAATGIMAKDIEEWPKILQRASISEKLKDVALKCLKLNQEDRPDSIDEVIKFITQRN
jgi:hypothetical protein